MSGKGQSRSLPRIISSRASKSPALTPLSTSNSSIPDPDKEDSATTQASDNNEYTLPGGAIDCDPSLYRQKLLQITTLALKQSQNSNTYIGNEKEIPEAEEIINSSNTSGPVSQPEAISGGVGKDHCDPLPHPMADQGKKRKAEATTNDGDKETEKKKTKTNGNGEGEVAAGSQLAITAAPITTSNQNMLLGRLQNLYEKEASKLPKGNGWTDPFFIPEIMRLWKISKLPTRLDPNSFENQAEASSALVSLAEFLNTGKVEFEEKVEPLFTLFKERLVNEFVIGLMLIATFSGVSPEVASVTKDKFADTSKYGLFGTLINKIVSNTAQGLSHSEVYMAVYKIISSAGPDWEEGFILDGECEKNFDIELKDCFYHRLYYEASLSPTKSALEVLLSGLQAGKYYKNEDIINLTYFDLDTNQSSTITVHSLVIMLLQNNISSSFDKMKSAVISSFAALRLKKVDVDALLKMLHSPKPVSDGSSLPLQSIQPLFIVDICCALRVHHPLELFYLDFSPTTPFAFKLAVCLYCRTLNKGYLFGIIREPFKYMTIDNVSLIDPSEMQQLIMLDHIAFKEKELYDFLLSYCKQVGERNKVKKKSITSHTRNLLLPFVRYSVMSSAELEMVSNDGFLTDNDLTVVRLLKSSTRGNSTPDKFKRANVHRKTYEK